MPARLCLPITGLVLTLCDLRSAATALTASWQPAAASLPAASPPRSGATASGDQSGRIWLFGGYGEEDPKSRDVVSDLLQYEDGGEDGGGWSQLQPSSGRDGSTGRPGPRLAGASAVSPSGEELLLFGGWDPQEPGTGGIILDDVWSLSLADQSWKKCDLPMPGGPTSRHVACTVGDKLVVHTFRSAGSVLVWDAKSRALKEQPTTGECPSSRGLHVAAAANDHTVVVFGGAAKDGAMCNDAFALDTRTWQWRPLAPRSSSSSSGGLGFLSKILGGGDDAPNRPSPRAGACAAPLPSGDGIVVCCGAEAGVPMGLVPRADVWALTLDSEGNGRWTCLLTDDAPNAPAPRNAATLTPFGGRPGELLLHGGWHPFVRTYSDSHVLRLEA